MTEASAAALSDAPRPKTTPGRALDPLGSWRRHWLKMVAIAAAVVGLGVPVAWVKGRATFYAEAAVRVSPTYVENLQDESDVQLLSTTQYLQFVQQQITTVRSFDVAVEALHRLGDQRALWQRPHESERRAAERLMAAITVRAVRDTYLITIGLEGEKAAGLADIVNAVADAYVKKASEEGLYGPTERIRHLTDRRADLQARVGSDVDELKTITARLGVSTFEDSSLNPLDSSLVATGEALADWRRRRIAAEAKVAALQEAQARERQLELDSAARDLLDKNLALASATKLYYDRRNALLGQASGLAPDHPGYKAVQRQLAEIDTEMQRVSDGELLATKTQLEEKRATQAAAELSRVQMDADQARQVEAQLATDFADQSARLPEYTAQYHRALDLISNIRRARKRIESINNRIDSYSLEAQAPGFVRLVSPARAPDTPISGGRKNLLLLVCVAATGLALVVPLALDRFDPRILLPGDLEKALGFAPMAWLPERAGHVATALATDEIRRLALALARDRQQQGTARITLTSVAAAAGTTTLVLDLAHELARLGLRVLAIDANVCHRDHRYGTAAPAAGLGGVLAGQSPLDQAIGAADGGGPDLLPLGDLCEGDVLAHRPALTSILEGVRGQYDLVLLDAPPLGRAADAELLVQVADSALLVVGAATVTGADVKRAARILERLAPPVVGVVLNRVRTDEHTVALAGVLRDRQAPSRSLIDRWLWGA